MSIATRVKWFIESRKATYDVLPHPHTDSSRQTIEAAQVPGHQLAKCVLLEDEAGYLVAVLPASRHIALRALNEQLHRQLELATEKELNDVFPDCEVGAVPPFGSAYNIPTVIDDSLLSASDVYFEGGDHEDLVHMKGAAFLSLLSGSRHAQFGRYV